MKTKCQIIKLGLLLAALLPTFAFRAEATTFYVNVSNTVPLTPFNSWSTAATNIQNAIDIANDGDLILVTNGVYATGGRVVYGALTNRVVINKAITVRSVNGSTFTFIGGNSVVGTSAIRGVYMSSNSVLSGFTITNGGTLKTGDFYQEMSGGGIWAIDTNDVVVTNCVLAGNAANQLGGGIYNGIVQNCMAIKNTANNGGGVANSIVANCIISNNSAFFSGGGATGATIINSKILANYAGSGGGGVASSACYGCLIVSNLASGYGGGIYMGQNIVNCTIVGNSAGSATGGVDNNIGLVFVNNTVYFNTVASGGSPNYFSVGGGMYNCCTIPKPAGGAYNFTNAPNFVDYVGGDYHLASNSPCINSGGSQSYISLSTDLDGNPRVVDTFVDVGAYENQNSVFVLPFWFALQYGLSLDGSIDSDGDGMNNFQEAFAGTNPNSAKSVLKILPVAANPTGATVSWQCIANKNYYLQRSTNLALLPAFTTIRSNISRIYETTINFQDTTATNGGSYFYRIGVQ